MVIVMLAEKVYCIYYVQLYQAEQVVNELVSPVDIH
jgi:hypothetical protein